MKPRYFILWIMLILLVMGGVSGCTKNVLQDQQEITGTVFDYTGFDGCGYIIELNDGTRLEPVELADTSYKFRDGQKVAFTYIVLNRASICMVGQTVRIETIRDLGSIPIQDLPIDFVWDDLPDDPFNIHSAVIVGDDLIINLSYSGGCRNHQFSVFNLPVFCGTPPLPPPMLVLCHEANGDMCEAFLTETMSVDLNSLRKDGGHVTHFVLTLNFDGSDYQKTFSYRY